MPRVNEITTSNPFYTHIRPGEAKDRDELIRDDKKYFTPVESLGFTDFPKAIHFFKNPTEEQKKIFHEKWVHELVKDETKEDEFIEALISSSYTKEQAKSILHFAKYNAIRAKDYALVNEKYGGIASNWMTAATTLGVLRQLYEDPDSDPDFIAHTLNISYFVTRSLRGYYQYHVYNSPGDDLDMNRYQADVYGSKIPGALANTAFFTETKINPVILTLSSLLPYRYQDSVASVLSLPNLCFWRSRMVNHINVETLTDFASLMIHKPLALFGNENSIEVLNNIKERRNLELPYIWERHCENIGLTDKKDQTFGKFVSQFFKSVKNSFNRKDLTLSTSSAKKVGGSIAPLFGFDSLVSTIIGIPLKVGLKALDIQSKIVNLLPALGVLKQQVIYLFKIYIPFFNDTKNLRTKLHEEENKGNKDENLFTQAKELYSKKRNMCFMMIGGFATHGLNVILKFFNIENPYLQKLARVTDGLSGDAVSKVFSDRRHVIGNEFRVNNPEFYPDDIEADQNTLEASANGELKQEHSEQIDLK